MNILIIEGIPTSGKTSVIKKISELVDNGRLKVYGEAETHEPIMDKPEDLHVGFFKALIQDADESNADFVIFDRFHLTQAYRAKVSLDRYSEVEEMLAEQETLVVYLQVDDTAIADRVKLAAEHRDNVPDEDFEWGEYFKTKGKTFEEIGYYYANQQRNQIELLKQSKLKSRTFNTTHHGYGVIAEQIINQWFRE